jgi:hypothetical protein
MNRDELYTALVDLCQQYGITNDETYDRLHNAIDTIHVDDPDDVHTSMAHEGPEDDRIVRLTVADQQALADVMGDAYAYRLGAADPNDLEALDPRDKSAMDRIADLAARLGIEPSY